MELPIPCNSCILIQELFLASYNGHRSHPSLQNMFPNFRMWERTKGKKGGLGEVAMWRRNSINRMSRCYPEENLHHRCKQVIEGSQDLKNRPKGGRRT